MQLWSRPGRWLRSSRAFSRLRMHVTACKSVDFSTQDMFCIRKSAGGGRQNATEQSRSGIFRNNNSKNIFIDFENQTSQRVMIFLDATERS